MIETIAVIGAGNGGKASAADLALQGKRVRLFEFPEYDQNLDALRASRRLTASGAVAGQARLELVTSDLAEAVGGADAVMVCTQAPAHGRVGRELAPFVDGVKLLVVNPGSTGGALEIANTLRERGAGELPVLVEFSTLTYGCRGNGAEVHINVKVRRVLYGTFPASAAQRFAGDLERCFPGLVPAADVLEAGLSNANPVIHPPIAVLNGARFENDGANVLFYRDGVSPTVAKLIEKLDGERMAILKALGYRPMSDPANCVEQGYAESDDYYACYARGSGFADFTAPNTLNNRYFHEDIGMGMVLWRQVAELAGVATPTLEAFVRIGSAISGIDYAARGERTLKTLGLQGLDAKAIKEYLRTGRR